MVSPRLLRRRPEQSTAPEPPAALVLQHEVDALRRAVVVLRPGRDDVAVTVRLELAARQDRPALHRHMQPAVGGPALDAIDRLIRRDRRTAVGLIQLVE